MIVASGQKVRVAADAKKDPFQVPRQICINWQIVPQQLLAGRSIHLSRVKFVLPAVGVPACRNPSLAIKVPGYLERNIGCESDFSWARVQLSGLCIKNPWGVQCLIGYRALFIRLYAYSDDSQTHGGKSLA